VGESLCIPNRAYLAASLQNRHCVLAHHADDVVMFDVPPPLQSKGMAEYKKRGISFSSIVLGAKDPSIWLN
jgi:hypothetical protein